MMGTARSKFQSTAPPAETKEMSDRNPRHHTHGKHAKPSGKSGKGKVKSAKRSTFRDGYRG